MSLKPQLSFFAFILSPEDPGSWDFTFDIIRAADRAGVDRAILTGEHVVFGENLEAYGNPETGGRTGGKQLTGPDGHFLDPLVAATHAFALTKQIRLTPNVILAPLRRPAVLAKTAATIDVLSNGRLDLGVGVGWQREEYEACGLDFAKRGRLLDHALEVCHVLWRERVANYSSPELTFERLHAMPKPRTPGGVPIWVSGNLGPPVVRRLAKWGAGWLPWGDATDNSDALVKEIPRMRDLVAEEGRDPSDIQIAGHLPLVLDSARAPLIGPTMERVHALVEAGITDFRCTFRVPTDAAAAEDFFRPWVTAFRDATGTTTTETAP